MRERIPAVLSALTFVVAMWPTALWADPGAALFVIEERDQDGRVHRPNKTPAIADINSSIRIVIRQDDVRRQAAILSPSKAMGDLFEKAASLRKAAVKGQESISIMQSGLAEWSRSSKDDAAARALQNTLDAAASPALDVFSQAPRGSALRALLNKALPQVRGKPMVEQYRVVFEVAAREAERLTSELKELSKKEGSYIQLGAWIRTNKGDRPIHLSGFDEYPLGERFEVTRFNFALSEEQKKQMAIHAKQATEINEKGLGKWVSENLESFVESAPEMIASLADNQILPCIAEARRSLDSLSVAAARDSEKIRMILGNATEQLHAYESFVNAMHERYKAGGSAYTMPPVALLEAPGGS